LAEFAQDVMPQLTSAVVLVGTPGPTQQLTVQLWDKTGRILGYLKYAEERTTARRRLQQERFMLSNLPHGVGPELVKFGPLGNGDALLESVLQGKPLRTTLPPGEDLIPLLDSLVVAPPVPLDAHPWVRRMRDLGPPAVDAWFEPLSSRRWPVVIQHGDFAPWNLLRRPDGVLQAVDWEHGTLEGFPYLDLVHFILQTSALVYRLAPPKAARNAASYLSRQPSLALNQVEAHALVRLTAYDAYIKTSGDGQLDKAPLQVWRRAIWERKMREA
jgi:hypothetical protein